MSLPLSPSLTTVSMPSDSSRAGSVRAKLFVNIVLAVSFVAISAPQATRMPVHEWLSLAFIGLLTLHVLFSWGWIVSVARRLFSTLRPSIRFNFLWDSLLYLTMTTVMVSGVIISEVALPALGIPRTRDRFWAVLHDRASMALLVIVGIHLALHWDWIVAALSRFLSGALRATPPSAVAARSWLAPATTFIGVAAVVTALTVSLGSTPIADRFRNGARSRTERSAKRPQETAVRSNPVDPSAPRRSTDAPGEQTVAGPRVARAPELSRRQRFVRPAKNIAKLMGIPFVVVLALVTLARRARPAGERRPADPLVESVD